MTQPQISVTEIDARITMLTQQRNEALDRCAILAGLLALANEKNKALEEKVHALETPEAPEATS